MKAAKKLHLLDTEKDKQVIEALRAKLSDLLVKDPKAAKKAALILSQWLDQPKRK